jgi:hypothetical protein
MQQFRRFQRGVPCVLLMAVLLVLTACARDSPEQAVRAQLQALQAAVDARDASDVHALLAENFVGNEGMGRREARQLAAATFLRYRDIGARFGPVAIEMRGSRDAVARFTVLATGGSGALLPQDGQVFEMQTGWRLIDGEWRLLNASWTPRL